MPSVLLYTGHLVDGATAAKPRLRPEDVPTFRDATRREVARVYRPGMVAAGSLAAGADLLFAHAVLEAGMPLHIFLPFVEADFLRVSVCYPRNDAQAPHDWQADYHTAMQHPLAKLVWAPAAPFTHNAQFADCNTRMLAYVLDIAKTPEHVNALCVYQPSPTNPEGGTGHFIEQMRQAGVACYRFWI